MNDQNDRDAQRQAAIQRIVDQAPPITAEQIVKLRRIFASGLRRDRAPRGRWAMPGESQLQKS